MLLEENSINILALQEESSKIARTACYVFNTINYQWRRDLEKEDTHVIILDVLEEKKYVFLVYTDHSRNMKQKQAEKYSIHNWKFIVLKT